ncbi:hypothetical protein T492DRAFT_837493 [Pavlovales sp. CCMP2436]|nr:hypothetical protein T492DRAFT_837493 [Pavlovales sp. CCMP2436]
MVVLSCCFMAVFCLFAAKGWRKVDHEFRMQTKSRRPRRNAGQQGLAMSSRRASRAGGMMCKLINAVDRVTLSAPPCTQRQAMDTDESRIAEQQVGLGDIAKPNTQLAGVSKPLKDVDTSWLGMDAAPEMLSEQLRRMVLRTNGRSAPGKLKLAKVGIWSETDPWLDWVSRLDRWAQALSFDTTDPSLNDHMRGGVTLGDRLEAVRNRALRMGTIARRDEPPEYGKPSQAPSPKKSKPSLLFTRLPRSLGGQRPPPGTSSPPVLSTQSNAMDNASDSSSCSSQRSSAFVTAASHQQPSATPVDRAAAPAAASPHGSALGQRVLPIQTRAAVSDVVNSCFTPVGCVAAPATRSVTATADCTDNAPAYVLNGRRGRLSMDMSRRHAFSSETSTAATEAPGDAQPVYSGGHSLQAHSSTNYTLPPLRQSSSRVGQLPLPSASSPPMLSARSIAMDKTSDSTFSSSQHSPPFVATASSQQLSAILDDRADASAAASPRGSALGHRVLLVQTCAGQHLVMVATSRRGSASDFTMKVGRRLRRSTRVDSSLLTRCAAGSVATTAQRQRLPLMPNGRCSTRVDMSRRLALVASEPSAAAVSEAPGDARSGGQPLMLSSTSRQMSLLENGDETGLNAPAPHVCAAVTKSSNSGSKPGREDEEPLEFRSPASASPPAPPSLLRALSFHRDSAGESPRRARLSEAEDILQYEPSTSAGSRTRLKPPLPTPARASSRCADDERWGESKVAGPRRIKPGFGLT